MRERCLLITIPGDVTDKLCGSCPHHRLDDETEGLYCDITAECVAESHTEEPERTPRYLEAEARAATDREIVRVVRSWWNVRGTDWEDSPEDLRDAFTALLTKEGEGTRERDEARAFASRQRDRAVLAEAERDARAPEMAAAYQALREAIAERDARPNVTPKGARHLVSINYSPMCECDICETVRSGYRAHAAKARKR